MDRLAVYGDGPGETGGAAVGFGVEIVSPASDGLGEGDGRSGQIQQIQGADLPEITQERSSSEPGNKSSVDRQSSGPDVDDIKENNPRMDAQPAKCPFPVIRPHGLW